MGKNTGLDVRHPLIRFFSKDGETVENYLELDDALFFGSIPAMRRAADPVISDMASRLSERRLFKTLDIADVGHDQGTQRQKLGRP